MFATARAACITPAGRLAMPTAFLPAESSYYAPTARVGIMERDRDKRGPGEHFVLMHYTRQAIITDFNSFLRRHKSLF